MLRATKFSAQFSKTSVFEENNLIHLSGQKMCLVGANQKKTSAGRNTSIYMLIQFNFDPPETITGRNNPETSTHWVPKLTSKKNFI